MLTPSQIKEIIREENLRINKRWGQNFLIDKAKRDRLVSLCDIRKDDIILEIGPGMGALTESILPLCKRLIAVERDRGFAGILEKLFKENTDIEVVNTDILDYKLPFFRGKAKVIGNLPFYITTAVIFYLLDIRERLDSIFITVQKEVARRITSRPGSKDYGILSIGVQYHCDASGLCNIPKSCFFPAPLVDSVFLALSIREKPAVEVKDEKLFFDIVKAGFNKRRKRLLNALRSGAAVSFDKEILGEAFSIAGLSCDARPESLGLEEFACLSDALSSLQA